MYSEQFSRLTPYTPGEQPKDRTLIKLNTNETPYPPCPGIKTLLQDMPIEDLRLYPDPQAIELREAIGKIEQVPASQIFVSNGSDEALSFCFFTFFDKTKGAVVFPRFTYSFYPVYCRYYDLPFRLIELDSDYSLDVDDFIRKLPKSSGAVFPNPNAPTGIFEEPETIEKICKAAGESRAVILDEAYIDFGGTSSVPLLKKYPNLVIVKTLSKGFSLAGARLGYTVASEEVTEALFTVKDSFNSYPIDRITQQIGVTALQNMEYYRKIQQKVVTTRERTRKALQEMDWRVLPSKANFLFAEKPATAGREIYSRLRKRGILVRHFDIQGIDSFVRISIGTDEEMDRFLEVCRGGL